MLKFTYLINFGLAGALIVPSVTQQLGSVEQLESSIASTDQAIDALSRLQERLQTRDYDAVEGILRATEKPFGDQRERSILVDRLREEIGQLEAQVQSVELRTTLPHTQQDPTETLSSTSTSSTGAATTGLSQESRDSLEHIWPPVPGETKTSARKPGERVAFEEEGFTVDAVRHGRAYYRADRYEEALRLISTRRGEPEADYWAGRCLERLGRPQEAIAAYISVENNPAAEPAIVARAKNDREFLEWLVDFDRKIDDLHEQEGAAKE